MTDYKNLFSSKFKNLEKEINRSFNSIHRIQEVKKRKEYFSFLKNHFFKNIYAPVSLFIIVCAIISFSIAMTFASKKFDQRGGSYLGMVKIQEELDSMVNINGVGGNEINNYDTNNSELKFFFYKIKQGESLYTISKKLGVSMDTLISLNSIDNANSLGNGKRIIVPNLQGIIYCVKKNDSLDAIASRYKVSMEDIKDANDLEDDTVNEGIVLFLPGATLTEAERARALGYLFNKPLHGRFTSSFGIRRDPFTGGPGYHPGIDISAPYGTSVRASKEGRVVFAGWQGGYGKCIIIKHQFGFETVYGHLSRIIINQDDWIKVGQIIGRVGSTGRSTGPHLHFEVRKFGRPTNPIRLSGLGKSGRRWY